MSSRFCSRLLVCVPAVLVVAIGLASSAQADVVLANRWAFDGNLDDSSGNGNNGTLSSGGAAYVDGMFGQKAISLATGQSVDNTTAVNLPTSAAASWSINFWYKAPGSQYFPWLAGFGDNTTAADGPVRALVDYNGVYLWGANADSAMTWQAYGADALHMITAAYQPGQLTVYYDGIQKYQGGLTGTPGAFADAASQIHVNQTTWSEALPTGVYQEFTIWNGALTSGQVSNLMTYNSPVPEPNTFILLVVGALGLMAYAWQTRK
jgi:hypothetical protein